MMIRCIFKLTDVSLILHHWCPRIIDTIEWTIKQVQMFTVYKCIHGEAIPSIFAHGSGRSGATSCGSGGKYVALRFHGSIIK